MVFRTSPFTKKSVTNTPKVQIYLYHWAVQATVEVEISVRPITLGEDDMQKQNELSLRDGGKDCEKELALDIASFKKVKILQDAARSRCDIF